MAKKLEPPKTEVEYLRAELARHKQMIWGMAQRIAELDPELAKGSAKDQTEKNPPNERGTMSSHGIGDKYQRAWEKINEHVGDCEACVWFGDKCDARERLIDEMLRVRVVVVAVHAEPGKER